jgi:hypothetical protein
LQLFKGAVDYDFVPWFRVARFFLVQTYQNGKSVPNGHKLYQTAIYYTKWPEIIPNYRKIFQHFLFKGPPKYTQDGIFGLKINHLATLPWWVCTTYMHARTNELFETSRMTPKFRETWDFLPKYTPWQCIISFGNSAAVYKDLKSVHPGGIRTRDLLFR